MRKRIFVFVICVLTATAGCAAKSIPDSPDSSVSSELSDLSGLSEPSSLSEIPIASEVETERKEPEIVSGNMYEITANNFIEGLDHDFSPDEINVWKEVIENDGFSKKYSQMGEYRYMIHLYGPNGVEMKEYLLDDSGRLFDLEGMYVANDAVDEMLEKIVKTE